MINRIRYPQPPAFGGVGVIIDRSVDMGPSGHVGTFGQTNQGQHRIPGASTIPDMQPVLKAGLLTDMSKRAAAIGDRPTTFTGGYVARRRAS